MFLWFHANINIYLHFPASQVRFVKHNGEHAVEGELHKPLNEPGPGHSSIQYSLILRLS